MEKWRKDTATEAVAAVYQVTLGNALCQMDSDVVLHHQQRPFCLALVKRYSIGPRSIWMLISLLLK
jgi:hypothetical protein